MRKQLSRVYKGYGVYRFLDDTKRTIYVGVSDNINRRMTKEHFTKHGHLSKKGKNYNKVARVDIIKLDDPADAAGLEIYLIDKYKPLWNDRSKSKSINMRKYRSPEYYDKLENWKEYIQFKVFDDEKIKLNRFQGIAGVVFAYSLFIGIIILMLTK